MGNANKMYRLISYHIIAITPQIQLALNMTAIFTNQAISKHIFKRDRDTGRNDAPGNDKLIHAPKRERH